MSLEDDIDLADLTPEQVNSGGGSILPGMYHVSVQKVTEETSKKGNPVRLFELLILDGTVKGCKNMRIFERLHMTANTKQRVARFAKVFGLISDSDLGKGPVKIDWSKAKYKQAVVQVVPQKDEATGKPHATYTQVDFMGIFALDDERVKHVPKDAKAAAGQGITVAPAAANGTAADTPARPVVNVDDL